MGVQQLRSVDKVVEQRTGNGTGNGKAVNRAQQNEIESIAPFCELSIPTKGTASVADHPSGSGAS
jgi:hypothetical protein